MQLDEEEEELLLHYKKMWAHHIRITTSVCRMCRRPVPNVSAPQIRPKDIIVTISREVEPILFNALVFWYTHVQCVLALHMGLGRTTSRSFDTKC